jgi:hypothetical protein
MLCNSRKCTVIYNAERLVIAWGRKMKKVKRYYKGTQGELGIVVNTCNTSTQENESEGLELTSQTELYQNPVSKKGVQDQKKKKKKESRGTVCVRVEEMLSSLWYYFTDVYLCQKLCVLSMFTILNYASLF